MKRRDFLISLATLPFLIAEKKTENLYPAKYYKKLDGKRVQCLNCPHHCVLKNNETGFCRVRRNINGELFSLVFGNPCAVHIDPIEKKPLFHFFPGTTAFSIATVGCNFRCKYCQNYSISQVGPDETENYNLSPDELIKNAILYRKKYNISTIAYTYTEPVVFFEYMLEIAKVARKNNFKNMFHSNGFIEEEPLKEIINYLDAANVDLKFFNEKNYKEISSGSLEPVLRTLKILKENKVHLEITNLVIPTLNDNMEEIKNMVLWIKNNLGEDTPIHFSCFFPTYKLTNLPPTPVSTVEKARDIAIKEGMKYVYMGNVPRGHPGENTYCPNCKELLIKRWGFDVQQNKIKNGKCPKCKTKIEGVWE